MIRVFIILMFLASAWLNAEANRDERGTIYSPIGKRDPFKPVNTMPGQRGPNAEGPLDKYSLDQFQLRAILRGEGTKARAMLEDPGGKTHIVSEGDTLGREKATVSRILNSEVILTERTFNYLGSESLYEKILSLPPDTSEALEIRR